VDFIARPPSEDDLRRAWPISATTAAPLRPGDGGLMRIIAGGPFAPVESIPARPHAPRPTGCARRCRHSGAAHRRGDVSGCVGGNRRGRHGGAQPRRGPRCLSGAESQGAGGDPAESGVAGIEARATVVAGPVLVTLPKYSADIVFSIRLRSGPRIRRGAGGAGENPPGIAVVQHSVRFALARFMACCGARAS